MGHLPRTLRSTVHVFLLACGLLLQLSSFLGVGVYLGSSLDRFLPTWNGTCDGSLCTSASPCRVTGTNIALNVDCTIVLMANFSGYLYVNGSGNPTMTLTSEAVVEASMIRLVTGGEVHISSLSLQYSSEALTLDVTGSSVTVDQSYFGSNVTQTFTVSSALNVSNSQWDS